MELHIHQEIGRNSALQRLYLKINTNSGSEETIYKYIYQSSQIRDLHETMNF